MTHDTSDKYNGWSNRETWAVNLHLTNDESLYHAAQQLTDDHPDEVDRSRAFQSWVSDELFADETLEYSPALRMMRDDVGSVWRVDWQEIAAAWEVSA